MADELRLTLLGGLQITLGGAPVTDFVSSKAPGLLCYLAVTGRPHSRDALAGLLWGEVPEANAKASLRTALSSLRRQVASHLEITRSAIAFNRRSPYWLDIAAFIQQVRTALPPSPNPLLFPSAEGPEADRGALGEIQVHALQAAGALYRGDFLEGFHVPDAPAFEEWILGEREWLRQLALQALHRLMGHYTARGAYTAGIETANRLLTLEPWQEETHRQLMHLLALSGQRSKALAQYETCRRVLAEELGVAPTPETAALYERIRDAMYLDVGAPMVSPMPPLLQTPARLHNLPLQVTPLIGRQAELEQLVERLLNPEYRLLTLVGPGGVGKTRLALAAAELVVESFPHGAWFVPLTGVTSEEANGGFDPSERQEGVVAAIADTLGFTFSGQNAPQAQLLDHLRPRKTLLLLDNLEHLLDEGTEFIIDALRNAPGVTILVTSRQRLKIQAEYASRVEGLPIPAASDFQSLRDVGGLLAYSSVRLFVERADRTPRGFVLDALNLPDVIQVCQLIEGLPLGIELAAAWVEQLSPAEIAHAVQHHLDFLTSAMRDAPARHRSMRAVFESSWQLLPPREQATLAQVSVFRGGFEQEAALAITEAKPADLQSLVDESLLRREPPGRYDVHELIRQFAAEKLEGLPDLEEAVQERHSAYYLDLIAQREAALKGRQPQIVCAEIQHEWENVERAWCCAAIHAQVETLASAFDGLSHFLRLKGLFHTGEVMLGTAAGAIRVSGDPGAPTQRVLGRLLVGIAHFLHEQARYTQAATVAQSVIELAQAHRMADLEAAGRLEWGRALLSQGNYQAAQAQLEQALAQASGSGSPETETAARNALGCIALDQGAWDAAARHFEEELALAQAHSDWEGIARATYRLGDVAWLQGKGAEAARYAEESLTLYRELGNRQGVANALTSLALAAEMRDAYEEAERYHRDSLAINREIGNRRNIAVNLNNLGYVAYVEGMYVEAERHFKEALTMSQQIGHRRLLVNCLATLGVIHAVKGESEIAWNYLRQGMREAVAAGIVQTTLNALVGVARLQAQDGRHERAAELLGLALSHPALESDVRKDTAEPLLATIREALPADQLDAALARGQALDLGTVVTEILAGETA